MFVYAQLASMSSQHSQAAAVRQAQNTIGMCHVAATALRFHGACLTHLLYLHGVSGI